MRIKLSFIRKRVIEMLWIGIGLGVCLVALFRLLNFIAARQMEQDIAFILAEYPTIEQSPMPPNSQVTMNVIDKTTIEPVIIDQCFEKGPA